MGAETALVIRQLLLGLRRNYMHGLVDCSPSCRMVHLYTRMAGRQQKHVSLAEDVMRSTATVCELVCRCAAGFVAVNDLVFGRLASREGHGLIW